VRPAALPAPSLKPLPRAQVPYERVVQAWRMKHWPANHYSEVSLVIRDLGDQCRLELTQTGVPAADLESTQTGWRAHQWERMKTVLGFGSGFNLSF